jgi:HEXXH motif-containing protein
VIGRHRLSPGELTGLASGLGGAPAVRALRQARLSRHLLLLKFIAEEWPGAPGERDAALAVLFQAQARAPERVADLLADPLVGRWAAQTARRLRGSAQPGTPLWVDLGHLTAIAAAAAALSRTDTQLTGYVHDGALTVPTFGRARLPLPDRSPVRLAVRDGALRIRAEDWQGLRRLASTLEGASIDVALDDVNPYREGHHVPAADRLPAADLPRWRELFAGAWALLAGCAPARAAELAAGLRCLVPLADIGTGAARSATIRDAFGSFGLTRPASPAELAVTMVHEFQHSKLGAVLDLVPLYDAADQTTYYAPWRLDPRPIGGLLQGTYAFLGVADAWRALRAAGASRSLRAGDGGLREVAECEFASVREQVRHALGILESSGRLTPSGQQFAAGMRSTLQSMLGEQLPASVVRRARESLAENHAAWRRRHGAAGPVRLSVS